MISARAGALALAMAAMVSLTQEGPTQWPGFAVGPTAQELHGRPGQTLTAAITIATQRTSRRTTFDIEALDLSQRGSGAPGAVASGDNVRSCRRWLRIAPRVEVEPNGRVEVPYTVTLPADARGEYYSVLAVRLRGEPTPGRVTLEVQPAIQVRVGAKVDGRPARLAVVVAGLSIEASDGEAGHTALLQLRNLGELKTTVEGDILFRAPGGGFPARTPIPYSGSGAPVEVFPGGTVDVPCQLPVKLRPGSYTAEVRAVLLGGRRMSSEYQFQLPGGLGGAVLAQPLGDKAFKVDLDVEPAEVDLALPPGALRTVGVRVRNKGSEHVEIRGEVALVRMEPDGLLTFAAAPPGHAEPWVHLARDTVQLGPGRSTTLLARVAVPKERPEGGTLAGALVLRAKSLEQGGENDAASVGEYAVLILAHDPNAAPAKLDSPRTELIRPTPESNPRTVVVRVKNVGGRIGEVVGRVVLEGSHGQELAALAIGEQRRERILPGAEREFRLPIPFLDKGDYAVKVRLSPGPLGEAAVEDHLSFAVALGLPEGLKPTEGTSPPEE